MDIINTDIILSAHDVFWETAQQAENLSRKPVLIISTPFMPGDAESAQLDGILKAGCQLNESQYNIIYLKDSEQVAWHKLRDALQPKVVLLFNVMPSQLGIAALFRLSEINRFDDGYWVPTLSLAQVIEDKALKGNLWNNALKRLFVEKLHGDLV